MTVEQVFPGRGFADLAPAVAALNRSDVRRPFDRVSMSWMEAISRYLFTAPAAREWPELQALAFWMRRGPLEELAASFRATVQPGCVRVARGTVFHIPPANVDTIFVYSWLLSALCGNRNVLRLSRRRSPVTEILLDALRSAQQQHGTALGESNLIVSYGHEPEPTEFLSAACDVRVIWGGDSTVSSIRRHPLPPHGREVTFPDRYSYCVINAGAWLSADDSQRSRWIQQFYNDVFWFGQMACSSPHIVIWTGSLDGCRLASSGMYSALAEYSESRRKGGDIGSRMEKLTYSYRAVLDGLTERVLDSPSLTVLMSDRIDHQLREAPGGGLIFSAAARSLDDLKSFVLKKDQTLTCIGYDQSELEQFASGLGGYGIDRVVPVGQALSFERYWDGLDLLAEFTRIVRVRAQ